MARLPLDLARPAPSLGDIFNQAAALYQRGDFAGARRALKMVLRKEPQQFDALHLMGLVEAQRGHNKEAEVLLRQAVRVNPASAEAHANRGNVQRALERYDDAIASYDLALKLRPNYPNALNSRAIALTAVGRFDEALASYDQVLALDPTFAMAIYNRALALVRAGRLADAVDAFDQLLARDPTFVQGHVDRANALAALGRIDDALAGYERAVTLDPRFPPAHYNRGLALLKAGRHAEALASFDALLAIEPAVPGALDGRGSALAALGRHDEAVAAFAAATGADPQLASAFNNMGLSQLRLQRAADALASFDKALRIDRKFVGALNNRGAALLALGRIDDALAAYDKVLEIEPNSADAFANRGSVAMTAKRFEVAAADFARVLDLDRDHPYAPGNLLYARMQCADWRDFDALQAQIEHSVMAGAKAILPFQAVACVDSAIIQEKAAKIWTEDVLPLRSPRSPAPATQHDRIRLAYLSPDLRTHPVAILLAELFERHDRRRFETHAFSYGVNDGGALRGRLEHAFDAFHDVRELDDRAIAALMRQHEIDIVVDLAGFTENCRPGVLALRPTPIQVSYLGYLGPVGTDFADYVIADRFAMPDAIRSHMGERVVYLPDSLLVADTTRPIAPQPSRMQLGLPDTGVVFCAFHSPHKIAPAIFDVWMRLLKSVEGSVLWLAGGNAQSKENLRREAQARGVAGDRLVVMPIVINSEEYLARYTIADMFLDVLPYNAISTAIDALWAGLPIVSCAGTTFGGRGAGSALRAIGLADLVCEDLAAYEAMALRLAREPATLADIKGRLAANRRTCALFDTDRFRRHLEAAYAGMWERLVRGEPASDFAVG